MRRYALSMLAAAWLLVSCATPTPRPDTTQAFWSGKLALSISSTPPQRLSGLFELTGTPQQGQLTLISPLGQTLATAHWQPQSATLQRGSNIYTYPDLDRLTEALTGTPLPVFALFDWLQGRHHAPSGWSVDLSQQPQGRVTAQRHTPQPSATLQLVFQ